MNKDTDIEMTIGIDPDSKKHGISIYINKELVSLKSFSLIEFYHYLNVQIQTYNITTHIEDVAAVSAAFRARDTQGSLSKKLKIAQSIGMCKQAQIEIERVCDVYGVPVVKHKISSMWKKDKAQFEKVTGWTGRSNEDTRSGAWFGWLGCTRKCKC